jgi:hypothetical protein
MPPAIIGDGLLWFLLLQGTRDWPVEQTWNAVYAFLAWMVFSKFIKLVTHFVRYPIDILLWPVSILFGWFHGAIKVYAGLSLSVVRLPIHPRSHARIADYLHRPHGAAEPTLTPATRIA